MATAIEFFIEKFMSVMHIRLETTAGAFDDVVDSENTGGGVGNGSGNGKKGKDSGGLHAGGGGGGSGHEFDHNFDENNNTVHIEQELDLLGLDIEEEDTPVSVNNITNSNQNFNQNINNNNTNNYDANDFLSYSSPPISTHNNTNTQQQIKSVQSSFHDPFGDDPFGSSELPIQQQSQNQQLQSQSLSQQQQLQSQYGQQSQSQYGQQYGQQQQQQQQQQQPKYNDDPFADDMFKAEALPVSVPLSVSHPTHQSLSQSHTLPHSQGHPTQQSMSQSLPLPQSLPQQISDPFGDDPFGVAEPVSVPISTPVSAMVASVYSDPFAEEIPVSVPVPVPASVKPVSQSGGVTGGVSTSQPVTYVDSFGDDPFGGDSFSAPVIPELIQGPKLAPPLTPGQIEQHTLWLQVALMSSGGPLYDDGSMQIASKVEVRGSQGRITFYYRNQSNGDITDFNVEIRDIAGLIRCQLSPLTSTTLSAGGQTEQQLLVECMQPSSPGPSLILSFRSPLGERKAVLDLPLVVTTFNEPLALSGSDFAARWEQLVAPGQEVQEVLTPSRPIVPVDVLHVLTAVRTF